MSRFWVACLERPIFGILRLAITGANRSQYYDLLLKFIPAKSQPDKRTLEHRSRTKRIECKEHFTWRVYIRNSSY